MDKSCFRFFFSKPYFNGYFMVFKVNFDAVLRGRIYILSLFFKSYFFTRLDQINSLELQLNTNISAVLLIMWCEID